MLLLKTILIVSLLHVIKSYPYFPVCSEYDVNITILNTLNGRIKGACYDVTVNYASKTPHTSKVLTWLSIPYAEPPVGQMRFKNPVPIKPWNSIILDGTHWPNMCVQDNSGKTRNMSENCLYLNLFVPYNVYTNTSINRAPILIHIHGGSLQKGSSVDDRLEPSTLVAMSNVIVVTINYRLGPFGFIYINGTEAKGNQGFLDQHLALKWVYQNADLFGGDKNRITIAGQSAGSWSVGYHLLYKPSWPYFRNAILQSGNPLEPVSKKFLTPLDSTNVSYKIGSSIGCNATTNNQLFKCLQTANVNTLIQAYIIYNKYPPLVANGDFSDDPEVLFQNGSVKKCNILTGSNTKERAYFIKQNIDELEKKSTGNLKFVNKLLREYYFNFPIERYQPEIKKLNQFLDKLIHLYLTEDEIKNKTGEFLNTYIQALTDTRYKCPAYGLAETYSNLGLKSYVYLYGYHISTSEFSPKYEAVHGDELAMIFAEPLSAKKPPIINPNPWTSTRHNYSIEERLISEKISSFWTNFVKYDDPNDLNLNKTMIEWAIFKNDSQLRNIYFMSELPFQNLPYDKSNDNRCSFLQK